MRFVVATNARCSIRNRHERSSTGIDEWETDYITFLILFFFFCLSPNWLRRLGGAFILLSHLIRALQSYCRIGNRWKRQRCSAWSIFSLCSGALCTRIKSTVIKKCIKHPPPLLLLLFHCVCDDDGGGGGGGERNVNLSIDSTVGHETRCFYILPPPSLVVSPSSKLIFYLIK